MRPPPRLDDRPDTSNRALNALGEGFDYFNVAGSGPTFPVAQRAAEAFRTWLNEVGMFSHVGYDAYNAALSDTRRDVAAFLGDAGGESRIAVMQSATDGLNTLIAALPPGTLVTTAEEHGSALLPLWRRGQLDSTVRVVPHRDDASFLADVGGALAGGASGLVISLVSCKSGKVLPVREACAMARARGAFTIVDAAQAAGHVPVDVRAIGADAVVVLGHKWLHGPLATGAVWVAEPSRLLPPRLGWRSRDKGEEGRVELYPDARRFETGTVDVAAYVGLRQALVVHRLLGEEVVWRVTRMRAHLLRTLARLPFDLVSRPEDPTGIVVVTPRLGGALDIVTAMWQNERIVVKHLSEPGWPDAIRISFWALHEPAAIERLGLAFERVLATDTTRLGGATHTVGGAGAEPLREAGVTRLTEAKPQ